MIPFWWKYAAIGAAILGLGLWIQTLRVEIAQQQTTIQSDRDAAAKFKADAAAETARRALEMEQTKETYNADLARQKRALSDAVDTSNRLRNAVTIYAGINPGMPAVEAATVLRDRLQALGVLHEQLAEDYRQRAAEADGVNDALRACETTVAP